MNEAEPQPRRRRKFVLEVEQPAPLNLTRADALVYGGWSLEAFAALIEGGRLSGNPFGPGGELVYPRATVERVALEDRGVLPRPAPRFSSLKRCYFIGGDEGPVKIGFSILPRTRLRQIQAHNPTPLRILASIAGGLEREQDYHRRFAAARLHGEWFERTAEVIAEIDRINREEAPPPFRQLWLTN